MKLAVAFWTERKNKVLVLFLHLPKFIATLATNSLGGDVGLLCKRERVVEEGSLRRDSYTYTSLLQECLNMKCLPQGKLVHAHIIQTGFNPDISLGNKLVIMYAKCGSLVDARRVLDEMPDRNAVSWTVMIAAYVRHGHHEEALELFHEMQRTGIQPDQFTFASVLPACANLAALDHGSQVHEDIIRRGFQWDIFVQNALVDMYAKCGSIEHARHVFDKMPERNLVSWNAMIAGYSQNGRADEALQYFRQMQLAGVEPNLVTFASVFAACASLAALHQGKDIHEDMIRGGFDNDAFVGNALIDMYSKCGSAEDAYAVFDKMPERNVVSWTAMIAGYAQNERVDEALRLFQKMPERNVVSWNAMITGYAQNGRFDLTLMLFQQMKLVGVKPNSVTFTSVLPACANLGVLEHGKQIHEDIIRRGLQSDTFVVNALVDMYAKCGRIEVALELFHKMSERDVVSWTAMVAGFIHNGNFDEALKLFREMQLTGVKPNLVTISSVLSACANLAALEHGKEIHEGIIRYGLQGNISVGNALVDMYAKCGSIEDSCKVFNTMFNRDVVSWTAMIAGYTHNGHFDEALKLFRQMQLTVIKPNSPTFASVLPACANLAALQQGKEVHKGIIRNGFQSDVFVGGSLIDMYAKCGSIQDARKVFDRMSERDVVSWTAMIVGYAMHGCGKEALELFEQLLHSGTKPNHVTFIGVLSACCHAGLLDDGWQYFGCMSRDYHITPALEHYCCMVDLLGRAGTLNEAHDFINKMPIKPNAAVWGSLLGACRIHCNVELAEHVAEHLFELDPKNSAYYVLLSNIYAAAGRWDDTEKVRKLMKERRVKRMPGCSWIEVKNKVHAFLRGDRSHPQMQDIYTKLEKLYGQMKEAGYMPNTNFVLHDVEEEQKEHILYHHSEKLAIAFGLINTSGGATLRIVKNLRVCGDCHSVIKLISKIVAREIVVRDASRFHHFKDGWCSCGDYW